MIVLPKTLQEKIQPLRALKPRRRHANYAATFRVIFLGSFYFITTLLVLLLFSYVVLGNHYVIGNIIIATVAFVYLIAIGFLQRYHFQYVSSLLLVLFYGVIGSLVVTIWGVNVPFGIVLLSITIMLSSILLGARPTIFVTSGIIIFLFLLQWCITYGGYSPTISDSLRPSSFGDVIAYAGALGLLALISWLFSRHTELLLSESDKAKQALAAEKVLLEVRVKARTAELEERQLEEIRQLYRFVEMGQLSAALIHDLANHLTILTFDFEGIKQKQHSRMITHAQRSLGQLESIVAGLKRQLKGTEDVQRLDVQVLMKRIIREFPAKKRNAVVALQVSSKKKIHTFGDPLRFSHIMTILINNAIEAYEPETPKKITITIKRSKQEAVITVRDWGKGIAPDLRERLFEPVDSIKQDGLGIGLFIAHKITLTHFKGRLDCTRSHNPTEFTLRLPLYE